MDMRILWLLVIATRADVANVPNGLCVFDYDNTLTRGTGYLEECCGQGPESDSDCCAAHGPTEKDCGGHLPMDISWGGEEIGFYYAGMYAAGAIKACELNNMRIGLATASACPPSPDNNPLVRSRVGLLEKLGFPRDVAPGNGLAGPAYMCSLGGKRGLVHRLEEHYGIPPNKTVFFDDASTFLEQVSPIAHTVLASSGSRGCNGDQIFCAKACGISKSEVEDGLRKVLGRQPLMPDDSSALRETRTTADTDALIVTVASDASKSSEAGRNPQTSSVSPVLMFACVVMIAATFAMHSRQRHTEIRQSSLLA